MTRLSLTLAALLAIAAPAFAAPEPTGKWYATQFHAHSRYSDGIHSVADIVRWAKEAGLDAVALTDHQTDKHVADPGWQAAKARGIVMIPAYEWTRGWHNTWDGGERPHMSVWGLKPGETPVATTTLTRDEATAYFKKQGLTVGANHPYEPRFPWPDEDFSGVQAMEVWQWRYGRETTMEPPANAAIPRNSLVDFQYRNAWAIALWRRALMKGQRIAPLATADFHIVGAQQLESPCTLVYSKEATSDGILAGVRAGHVMLVRDPKGPKVMIEADADHDGIYEAMAGDQVDDAAPMRIRATGAQGLTLSLWRADGEVAQFPIRGTDWTRTFLVKPGAYFARVDRTDTDWDRLQAMTGALYVQ